MHIISVKQLLSLIWVCIFDPQIWHNSMRRQSRKLESPKMNSKSMDLRYKRQSRNLLIWLTTRSCAVTKVSKLLLAVTGYSSTSSQSKPSKSRSDWVSISSNSSTFCRSIMQVWTFKRAQEVPSSVMYLRFLKHWTWPRRMYHRGASRCANHLPESLIG